jgi:cardiolipin synthase
MDTSERNPPTGSGGGVATLPNAISLFRILLTPFFVVLIVDRDTTTVGLLVFAGVVATDWVDGTIARRTGQVSEVGKVLDPVADRLAIGAGIVALAIRGIFPIWAGVLILARDVIVLAVGLAVLLRRHLRIDVRWIGKVATFSLMVAVPAISWGALDLPLAAAATAVGWVLFGVGIIEYYLAAFAYGGDARTALASS